MFSCCHGNRLHLKPLFQLQVVAPVRETCAQTLGVVMKFLDTEAINGVLSILIQLLKQQQWEVRHGGLLGIKYLLAVRMVS